MDNIEKYKSVYAQVFNVEISSINEKFSADTVDGWDSVHQLNIVALLEENFDVMFDPEDIMLLTSYSKGIEILKKYDVEI